MSEEIQKWEESVREILEGGGADHRETVYFANGYGVSVIRNAGSYGFSEGLFEVAVLGPDGELDYSTPVTNDVLGWQSVDDVLEAMKAVSELPAVLSEAEVEQAKKRIRIVEA